MMGRILVAIVLTGCPPKPVNNAPIEYVGGTDRHPGVPVGAGSPPSEDRCTITTQVAPLETFMGELPDDVTDAEVFTAALQFLVTTGSTIETRDPLARTIVTQRADGQTWLTTCSINKYFMYAFQIAIAGRRMIVGARCWSSTGWEASPGVPRDRGELKPCAPPTLVSEGDARIPSMIFDGTIALIDLGRPVQPELTWWCVKGRLTCFRDRGECTSKPNVKPDDCQPRTRAYCPIAGPRVCFGDIKSCAFDGRNNDRVCRLSNLR